MLHIIPGSYDLKDSINMPGTKVYMKMGENMSTLKKLLIDNNMKAVMIENCGMDSQKIYKDVNYFPDDASYYSIVIVKDNQLNH